MRVTLALSGGLDSALIAKKLYEDGYDVEGVFLNVGQDNVSAEKAAAQITASGYCVGFHEITLDLGHSTYWFDSTTGNYSWTEQSGWTKSRCPNWLQLLIAIVRAKALSLDTTEAWFGTRGDSIKTSWASNYEDIDADQNWVTIRPALVFPIVNFTTNEQIAVWANNANLNDFTYCV